MASYAGQWHGKRRYFGLHYDLHAGPSDTELGLRAGPKELVPMLELMGADFVQTDCKGHPGYTSWRSKTPEASVSPGVRKDALKGWRAATKQLGLPLHCHYSGIWDQAAGARHPEWCVVGKDGEAAGAPFGPNAGKPTGEKMCPRGPYLETLMLPQLLELIDRYEVDGFWVDGEIWAVEPCYCERCRDAFREATGIAEPPKETTDPDWVAWINFTREGFEQYVTRYCDAIHAHKPGVLVCSNWLQTFKDPGEPRVPTDWISGDNTWVFGLDGCRCEARFISTRGKPWDIMIWAFYFAQGMSDRKAPPTYKPVQMLEQEAAVVAALGGNVQIYDNSGGVRDGRLIPWRMKRLREVGRFVKARRALCQGSETIPQVAVLHSEAHVHSQAVTNLHWGIDATPVQGATFSLLENHYGVDVLDEWALTPRLSEFAVVVAPEQDRMSDGMVNALKAYVRSGGKLLVSGAAAYDRFGGAFLGVTAGRVEEQETYHVPAADGSAPVYSETWRLVKPKGAEPLRALGKSPLLDDRLLPHPAATLHQVGKGAVAYIPCDIFRAFNHNRYPLLRAFVGEVTRALAGELVIQVAAPTCVDVILRRKGAKTLVHLINRASGIPNRPNDGTIDDIPPMGPITIEMRLPQKPTDVRLAFEKGAFEWRYVRARKGGKLIAKVAQVGIHAAVVVT